MKKIKEIICRIIGHKFDLTELAMFQIECSAENRKDLRAECTCKRCGKNFIKPKGI